MKATKDWNAEPDPQGDEETLLKLESDVYNVLTDFIEHVDEVRMSFIELGTSADKLIRSHKKLREESNESA